MTSPLDWLLKNRAQTLPSNEDRALRPRFFPFPPAEVIRVSRRALEGLVNWRVKSEDGEKLRAERSTSFFGFVDDVEIAAAAHPAGSVVSAGSASRAGKGDLGQNKRNILEFYDALGVELMDERPPPGFEGLLFCHFTERPFEEVAPLFFDPEFLPVISPPWTRIRIINKPDPIKPGARMELTVAGTFRLEVQFVEWTPPYSFTDRQTKGPFEGFIHRHSFEAKAGGCVVLDRIHYKHKFGRLGAAAGDLLTGGGLTALLSERAERLDAYLRENVR